MTATPAIPAAVQDELFQAGKAQLHAEMGNVSIVKFLNARSEDEARANWFDSIHRFVEPMPGSLPVRAAVSSGSPTLAFGSELVFTIRLFQLFDGRALDDAWRLTMVPELSAVVIDAAGRAAWGQRWDTAVQQHVDHAAVLAVVPAGPSSLGSWTEAVLEASADADPHIPGARGWMVGGVPGPSAYLWFRDRSRAERAARALAVGASALAALFDELRGAHE